MAEQGRAMAAQDQRPIPGGDQHGSEMVFPPSPAFHSASVAPKNCLRKVAIPSELLARLLLLPVPAVRSLCPENQPGF
jgi:hypothetical protein